MAKELDKFESVGEMKHIHIRERNDDGTWHRKVVTPDMDVSNESERVQEAASKEWTNEVKDKWAEKQENFSKEIPAEEK